MQESKSADSAYNVFLIAIPKMIESMEWQATFKLKGMKQSLKETK